MKVVILGAGGHGQVVADILLARRDGCEPVSFLDDAQVGSIILGLPVAGRFSDIQSVEHDAAIVAIGDNERRAQVIRQLERSGEHLVAAIHPSAVVAGNVSVGAGAMICAGAVINTGSAVEKGAILNTGCTVDHHSQIGECAHIAPGVHMGGSVRVGRETLIGIGAVVLPGRTIGQRVTVAAGAVVVADVADDLTVMGVPARILAARNP